METGKEGLPKAPVFTGLNTGISSLQNLILNQTFIALLIKGTKGGTDSFPCLHLID